MFFDAKTLVASSGIVASLVGIAAAAALFLADWFETSTPVSSAFSSSHIRLLAKTRVVGVFVTHIHMVVTKSMDVAESFLSML